MPALWCLVLAEIVTFSLAVTVGCNDEVPGGSVDATVGDMAVMDMGPPEPGQVVNGFAFIPAGEFIMGSPEDELGRPFEGGDGREDQQAVTLSRSFWMKTTEVIQQEYLDVMGTNPIVETMTVRPRVNADCGLDCPVDSVSWFDVLEFCNTLSRKRGPPGVLRAKWDRPGRREHL